MINLDKDKTLSFKPPYNLSSTELWVLQDYIKKNLEKRFIRQSISLSGASILFFKKKDGSLWLCVDYRDLNIIIIKNWHPLLLISEALDCLVSGKVYPRLDIWSVYNLIYIKEGDKWKTVFRTCYSHFEYLVILFGLANTPVMFQGYINQTLHDFLDKFCIVYLNNILIYSEVEADHKEHIKKILSRLHDTGLYCKLKKCKFSVKKVGFVRFVVSPDSVTIEDDCVATIKDWPELWTHHNIQVVIRFVNFYRQFIKNFSKVTSPLTELLKSGKAGKFKSKVLQITDKAKVVFNTLKVVFQTTLVLCHFNPDKLIRLEVDASEFAITGILS